MSIALHYLFDPLCGWCYGAAPAIEALSSEPGITIELRPTGLFSGAGARAMDDGFAAYAWSNDQRIEQFTGQPFSEVYRQQVLGDRRQRFDSTAATLALTAVQSTAPARELEALKTIQRARYVDGKDVSSLTTLVELLTALGLAPAAARLSPPTTDHRPSRRHTHPHRPGPGTDARIRRARRADPDRRGRHETLAGGCRCRVCRPGRTCPPAGTRLDGVVCAGARSRRPRPGGCTAPRA